MIFPRIRGIFYSLTILRISMSIFSYRFFQRFCVHAAIILGVGVVIIAMTTIAQSDSKQEKPLSSLEELESKEPRTRDLAVDKILQDRKAMIQNLIPLIDPTNANKYSDETRSASAYLLGEFRAVEAISVLSRALVNEPGPKVIYRTTRYGAPVWSALVKIGRPAVPELIKNLENSDDHVLREKSLDVLIRTLDGKQQLLELLAKLNKNAKDDAVRHRLCECVTYIYDTYKENAGEESLH
jgi:HEAT repeat protein